MGSRSINVRDESFRIINSLVEKMRQDGTLLEGLITLAIILQRELSCGERRSGTKYATPLDLIMRGVVVTLEDSVDDQGRKGYVLGNLQQGREGLAHLMPEAHIRK